MDAAARQRGGKSGRGRRVLVGMAVTLLGLAIAIWAVLAWAAEPKPPGHWEEVKVGMPREEVLGLIGAAEVDHRDMKGFEMWESEPDRYLWMDGRWTLMVWYDSAGRVDGGETRFQPSRHARADEWFRGWLEYRVSRRWSRGAID